jgi:hypothetical protein
MWTLTFDYTIKKNLTLEDNLTSIKVSNSLKDYLFCASNVRKEINLYSFKFKNALGDCYRINLCGEDKKYLTIISKAILNRYGVPNFVKGDYCLIKNVLREKGKTLKGKFCKGYLGKYVVDKK